MSLTASFLVSVQCTLFTVFFMKICIRTNSDWISISMDAERIFQIIFLLIMLTLEFVLFVWSLIAFDENEIDCHSPPFVAFSCIDVVQILCTIIAVCFIQRKISKQHQNNRYKNERRASLISNHMSASIQPLSVQKDDFDFEAQDSCGQVQMLHKSYQLLFLVICIFVCAVVTAIYETWNYLTNDDCSTFIKVESLHNELVTN